MHNCWETKKCGREPGGTRAGSLGVCPAATEKRLNGIHHGKNAGRTCWVVAGTLCGGAVAGTFAMKFDTCAKCAFYQAVKKEESPAFTLSSMLLNLIRAKDTTP